MSGLIAAAGIGLAGTAAATYASSQASKNANDRAGESIALARENSQMQNALQKEMLRQQREMQIAYQTDTEGNKLIYDPAQGWIPLLSDRGRINQSASQTAQDIERSKYFGRGQNEDVRAYGRRFLEGDQARQLMEQIRNQIGAPSREGVIGRNKLAGVAEAAEPAEALKAGAALTNVRTGGGASSLARAYQAMDPHVMNGVRAALARANAGGNEAYMDQYGKWRDELISPYKAFAAGAAPPGQQMPTSGMEATNASIAARAAKPMQINPYAGSGSNYATNALLGAMGQRTDMDWGKTIAGATEQFKNLSNLYFADSNKNAGITMTRQPSKPVF